MKHRYHLGRKLVALMLVLFMFASTAFAAELRVDSPDGLALSAEVFSESETLEGVYVASVPSSLDAELTLGGRTLRAGDVLDRTMLSQLRVKPAANRDSGCELVYFPIENGEVLPSRALSLSILTGKNEAPVCRDVKLETYKNIANTGALDARDPEGDTLTYQLVKEPKRGTVEISPDGSFTYTPAQNKVGKDVFTYTATDSAGNVSNAATVTVKIVKLMTFGAFAEIIPGVDGLIHISQIADRRIGKPEDVLSEGQEVDAKIIDIDQEHKRISLSIRALLAPADEDEE